MKHWLLCVLMASAGLGLTACAKNVGKDAAGGAAVAGVAAKPGALLAYEHTVAIELPLEQLLSRVDNLRAACVDERFGACSVLAVSITENAARPRATVTVRLVPDGVQSLIELAAQQGKIGSRQTRAEDLAVQVADTEQQIAQGMAQRQRLLEFRDRKDLAVTDMIALSSELATLDTRLADGNRASADQRRRIETNLLTLELTTPWQQESRTEKIGTAFGGFADSLTDGLSEAIELAGYGLPFLLLLFPLALLWRWLWRRAVGHR